MSHDIDTVFSDELNNLMQESIERETSTDGLLDLDALARRLSDEVKLLQDYKSKLVNNKSAILQAISLVDKRVKALSSAVDVLVEPKPQDPIEVVKKSTQKVTGGK